MMSYYKLVEMNNNGVNISMTNRYGSSNKTGGKRWEVTADKSADGVVLSIVHNCDDLDEGIDDIYQKWAKATGQGMPEHKLNILEHHKTPTAVAQKVEEFEEELKRPGFDENEIQF